MNSKEALDLINQIAATGNRAEKQELLGTLMADEIGRFIIEWTYNPYITYGIKVAKLPKALDDIRLTDEASIDVLEALLKGLSKREITGNEAKEKVEAVLASLTEPMREIAFRILAKDLKCGVQDSTINAVYPGFLKIFKVARAHAYEDKRIVEGKTYIGEPKLDGYRCTFLAEGGQGAFMSRSGKPFPAIQYLAEPLLKAARAVRAAAAKSSDPRFKMLEDYIFAGNEHPTFALDTEVMNGLFANIGAVKRKSEDADEVELHAFDLLPYEGFMQKGTYKKNWFERRALLEIFGAIARKYVNAPLYETTVRRLTSKAEIDAFYEQMTSTTLASYLARGDAEREAELLKVTIDKATGLPKVLEGAMIKDPAEGYHKGQSYSWLKLKPEDTLDLFIVGFYNGEPNTKYENMMGGAIVDHNGVEVRVGGGWSDEERQALWVAWCEDCVKLDIDPLVGFKGRSVDLKAYEGVDFRFLRRMIEVKFNEVTPDGSLRHPRKITFRDDKAGEALREAA